jgi:hypothetical protein
MFRGDFVKEKKLVRIPRRAVNETAAYEVGMM